MIDHLKTILPRIRQYSKNLNDTANFADIPWTYIDQDSEKVIYIFRRNQELLVSRKGDVLTGKWEYLPVMQSLIIDYEGKKQLFNQGFLDKAVWLLRKDGTDELFPLINPVQIENSDLVGYLERAYNRERTLSTGQGGDNIPQANEKKDFQMREITLKTGEIIVLSRDENSSHPATFLLDGWEARYKINKEPVPDGPYEESGGTIYEIERGVVVGLKEDLTIAWIVVFVILLLLLIVFVVTYLDLSGLT